MTHLFDVGAGVDAPGLLVVLGGALAVIAAVVAGTALWSRRAGKVSVVDVSWGLMFVALAWWSAVSGPGDVSRRLVLAVLVTVWGGRLAWHVWARSKGQGEDPRYQALLSRRGATTPAEAWRIAIVRVFALQGALAYVIALPIMVAAVPSAPLGVLAYVGVGVWLIGWLFEAVGDWQLRQFKADPANRGTIMDRGLWAWTRHPNYFGDACLWWGLWLISADAWPGVLTVASPVLMTYLVFAVSGARLLEKSMSQRPGWDAYAARTPMFVPRPPRGGGR